MSTTTYPVSGSFGGRAPQPVRGTPSVATRPVTPAAVVRQDRKSWLRFFGDACTAWASAGRLPL